MVTCTKICILLLLDKLYQVSSLKQQTFIISLFLWISSPRKLWFWVPSEVTVKHQLGLQHSQDQMTQMGMRYSLSSSGGYRHILVDHGLLEWGAKFLMGYWTDDLHPLPQHLGLHRAVQNMTGVLRERKNVHTQNWRVNKSSTELIWGIWFVNLRHALW